MKTIINVIILSFSFCLMISAQEYDYSYTLDTYNQNDVTVGLYIGGDDYNWFEKWQIKINYMNSYNGLEYKGEASKTYNCHYYAWFKTEQYSSSKYWLNYPNTNWSDYSFVKTTNEQYPGKVTYLEGSTLFHSAVTTSTSGRYISKWGSACLFEHDYDECPYWRDQGARTRFYYSRFVITGPSQLACEDDNYMIPIDSDQGYSINWSVNNKLTIDDYDDHYATIHPINEGIGVLTASIYKTDYYPTHYEPTFISTKVSPPYVNPATIQFDCIEGPGYFCTNAFGNEFSFTYDHQYNYFEVKLTNLSETQTYAQYNIYGTWGTMDCSPPEGTYLFQVRGNNDCGTATNWTKKAVGFVDCGMGGLFSLDIYPNPATEQATITIVSTENNDAITKTLDEEWLIEVYTQGQLLKHSVPAINDNKYILNTSGWNPGMYFIRAYYKDEVVFGTLVVNK